MTEQLALTDDLSTASIVAVVVVLVASLALLIVELGRRERYGAWIALSGVLALLLLGAAVLRPVRVATRGSVVGPRVVVLLDQSRRLLLPAGDGTRRDVARAAIGRISKHFVEARLQLLGFGDGAPSPVAADGKSASGTEQLAIESDLAAALSSLNTTAGERPQAVVVVSDGRLTRPGESPAPEAIRQMIGALDVPVHTVGVVEQAPRDASVRAVRAAGAAVAHQPLALTIQIGCAGGLECGKLPVTVRELRHGVEPAVLASGVAEVEDGTATVELEITLERAGNRVVEISIEAPEGDVVPENDRRILTFSVTRERLRLLHVAGRPTYDVRALRMWLKSDDSVDLVAFFILRTDADDTNTHDDAELALIPFPVDELFTEHLPSFDAVVLQDIDAIRYKLAQHLPALAEYVESGGGLIMVGGPSAFAGGGYAGTSIGRVLPVELSEAGKPFDTVEFAPRITEAGRAAPVLGPLRDLIGDQFPPVHGSNTLGAPRKDAIVLLEHPSRKAAEGGAPMPVLALGEAGDGRSIALGIDGTHQLAYGELAASVAGRSYGALWDGLLGWLMRDPRYESARLELVRPCIAGEPATIRLVRLPGAAQDVELTLERLGPSQDAPAAERKARLPESGQTEMDVGPLEAGGYTARARIGAAPPTRFDFACERGGAAWRDSRPDLERLRRISEATGGRFAMHDDVASLPLPDGTRIAAERHVSPLLPPWGWTLMAAMALGVHWVARRRGGLP